MILLPNAPLQRDFAAESSPLLSGTALVQQETKDGYFCSNCGYYLAPQDAWRILYAGVFGIPYELDGS